MLEVSSLTKRFGATLAVDGLSFRADPGRVLGFLGPNGAGKTTTLRTLLGLTLPTSGSATVDGRSYRELHDPVRVLGAVLEGPQFHPGRTGRNHLRVLAAAAGLPATRVDEVLRLVELDGAGARRVKGYSLGMRQRLSLAGALLGDPRGLVLDEPANGLDPQGIRWLRDFLRARAAEGRTVLISSHVLAEVAQTVDAVVVVSRGRLIAQGTVDELTAGAEGTVWVRSPGRDRLREALRVKEVAAEDAQGEWLAVHGSTLEAVGDTAAEQGVAVHELYRQAQSLEDVFLALTEGTEAGR
ncbi:MAG: ATP-binding cassette domain-containing protein [Thermoleophilaceae bacterium]